MVCFGLATDYCVWFTGKDSVDCGYNTYAVKELCRGIDPAFSFDTYTEKGITCWSLAELSSDGAGAKDGGGVEANGVVVVEEPELEGYQEEKEPKSPSKGVCGGCFGKK